MMIWIKIQMTVNYIHPNFLNDKKYKNVNIANVV